MPFTLSHAVVALPAGRLRLAPSAVVAGAIAPDVPYYVPLAAPASVTHTVLGALTVNAFVGVVLFGVWWLLLAQPLRAWLPTSLRSALPQVERSGRPLPQIILIAYLSAALGALSHVLWDAFTHPGRWGTTMFSVLTEDSMFGVPGHKVAQDLSTLIGLALLAWWLAKTLRRQRGSYDPGPSYPGWLLTVGGIAALAGLLAGFAAISPLLNGTFAYADARTLGFPFFTRGLGVAALVVVLGSGIWHLRHGSHDSRKWRST